MIEVGIFEAKTHLSELVSKVEAGEEVLITRRGRPSVIMSSAVKKHDKQAAIEAAKGLRANAKEMKLGVTTEEILEWIKEGRR
jgi:prevent-host-death family protein